MRYLSAIKILSPSFEWLEKHVLVIDDEGKVEALIHQDQIDSAKVECVEGVLIPGMVNAHCHLELSHMKDMIPTGTGLVEFIKSVVTQREAPLEEIHQAIDVLDKEMWVNGIQAVGDISNVNHSFDTKAKSKMSYHTFVEAFDFMQDQNAEQVFQDAEKVFEAIPLKNIDKKSIVPHAPYSVSKTLLKKISNFNSVESSISIHNQETWHENEMFLSKGGALIPFFESFGIPFEKFKPTQKRSIHYILENFEHGGKVLFVHNTQSKIEDIEAAKQWNEQIYWVSCPNANLYIENQLPKYQYFMDSKVKIALGTDSIASNWQLSILEEMKTIKKFQSQIKTLDLLRWACINGAEALGMENTLGSFEKGKKPGVLNLSLDAKNQFEIGPDTSVKRLF